VTADHLPNSSSDTVLNFFRYLDDQSYDQIPGLFTEDGVWHRRDQTIRGPKQVRQSLIELPPTMPTVHLVTNLQISDRSGEEAFAIFYVTALRPTEPVSKPPPWSMELPLLVTRYEAQLALTAGAWKIKMLRNEPVFRR
jgi:hypothetical protein